MKSRTWMWTIVVYLFAALAIPAQASVVYTPVNVYLPTNGNYAIDLNHDGITDFTFQISRTFHFCSTNSFAYRNTLNVQPTPAGVNPAGGIVGGNWASALQSGVQIDSHQSFYGGDDLMYDVQQSVGGPCRPPHMYGYWVFVQQRYLGLEFQINGQIHYGWAELSTDGRYGNSVNFLYGFAYETTPFKGILTGQTMDSPDEPGIGSDSVEPGDSGPTASVAPPLSAAPQLQSTGDTSAAMPVSMAAQDNPSQNPKPKHHQYKLVDMGTFGGPASAVNDQVNGYRDLNARGDLVGAAGTPVPLNQYSNGFPCGGPTVGHAFRYQDGQTTELGALPPSDTDCSNAQTINDSGETVGVSENGVIDPVLGINEMHGFIFKKHSHMADLGTLGGNVSYAGSINNRGQVVGFATNAIPDPNSMYYWLLGGSPNGTQTRAFLWEDGTMRDLGTLGGPDAQAGFINESGQVAGIAYLNSIVNPLTGIPTQDTFLWQNGKMRDLGNLGGSFGAPNGLNNRGQVTGYSNLAGDQIFQPFLWDGKKLLDLGTLGGDFGEGIAINDAGEVAGGADLPGDQIHDAFLWRKGVMTDLGSLGLTSYAHAISASGQVIGASRLADGTTVHAFLWENGGPMIDLNTLIPANSSLTLVFAETINERGEIGGNGVPSGCQPADVATCGHAFLLTPDGDCDSACEGRIATSQDIAAPAQNAATMKQGNKTLVSPLERFRSQMRQRYHIPGQPAAPRD